MKKLSVYDQIVFKHLKMRKSGYQTNFYMNSQFPIYKMIYESNSSFNKTKLCTRDRALTLAYLHL